MTLFVAVAALAWIAVRLRISSLETVRRSVGLRQRSHRHRDAPSEAREIARLVSIASRHGPWPATCLTTALALQWMLARRGIASALQLGVRGGGQTFEAHAWVEHDGIPLIESSDVRERFAAFGSLPPVEDAP